MVKLRLARFGGKRKPNYRIVAAESRNSRDGRFIEVVGRFDPTRSPEFLELNEERYDHWVKQGAQPSPTVNQIVLRSRKESK